MNDIERLEKMIYRLSRRSFKTAKAIVTPYPISNCITGTEINGPILKYMFIGSGIITKGKIWIGEKADGGVSIVCTIENDIGNQSVSYIMYRRDLLIEPNIPVQSGDRLTISIFPINPNIKIVECWIAFQWTPDIKETEIKQFLLDEIDKNVSKE